MEGDDRGEPGVLGKFPRGADILIELEKKIKNWQNKMVGNGVVDWGAPRVGEKGIETEENSEGKIIDVR